VANDPHYRLADDPLPKRRRAPVRTDAPTDDDEPAQDSFLARVMASDPFLIIIGVVVVTWVGLGLLAAKWPVAGFVLVAAGFVTIVVGQVYLYALIYREDGAEKALLSFLCKWYRMFYLFQNIELTLKPNVITGCGLLMILTGLFTFLNSVRHATPY
jgi:hypothetical protein